MESISVRFSFTPVGVVTCAYRVPVLKNRICMLVVPVPFVEKIMCSILLPLLLCQRLVDYICVYSWALYSIPLICVFFCQHHTVFTVALVSLDVGQCQSFNFILFLYCVGYSGSFTSLYKLQNHCQFAQNNLLGFCLRLCLIHTLNGKEPMILNLPIFSF